MPSQVMAHPAMLFLSHADTDLLTLHAVTARLPTDFPEIRIANPVHLPTESDVDAYLDRTLPEVARGTAPGSR